jgi:hypothetical protein
MSNTDNQDEPEPIEPETVPYKTPDGREHILDLDVEAPKVIKKPQSE